MGLLKAFFNWAKKAGHFHGDNPIGDFKPYVVNSKRREFTLAEMARIFNTTDKPEQKAQRGLSKYAAHLIRILSFTGMRLGEAINLKWASVGSADLMGQRGGSESWSVSSESMRG
jgi:integrase